MPEPLVAKQDTRTKLVQVITYIDDVPCLELTADEWIYPVLTRDEQFKLYFHMSPYQGYEVKKFYDAMIPRRRRRTNQESTIESPDLSPVYSFFDDHFLTMSGVQAEDGSEPTVAQQKEWLADHLDLKIRVFREGIDLNGVRDDEDVEQPAKVSSKITLLTPKKETTIKTEAVLYSKERKMDEHIISTHTMQRMTEADRHQYQKAIQVIENSRRKEIYTEANWDVIEGLYDRLVKSVSNYVLNGVPCAESNKETWKKAVPFCIKISAISQAYTEVELKNG